jgi:O-antigen ligase
MLGACLVLGGGGTTNPGTEVVLELLLALFMLVAIWLPGRRDDGQIVPRTAWLIAGLAVLIPLVQLVPLPPSVWHALPGRQAEVASLSLIGQAQHWMPWTLTPARTFASLLATLAELAVFLVAARLGSSARLYLCVVIAGIALVSTLLGSLQLAQAGGYTWSLYPESGSAWLLGFHANHNAATDTLQIGMLAIAVVIVGAVHRQHLRGSAIALPIAAMIGLAIAAILTGSRTGIALLPLTYLFAVWILWPVIMRRLSRASSWALLLVPPVAFVALSQTEQVQHSLSRFSTIGERRWDIWHDTIRAIGAVWPAGGGVSSFQVVYDATQSIERLMPALDVRAHNDWLEWCLEAGIPGLVVLTLIGAILLVCNIGALNRVLRSGANPDYRAQVIFATGTLLHIGLHGLLDYPMRSMALAALVGTAAAMLMPLPRPAGASE